MSRFVGLQLLMDLVKSEGACLIEDGCDFFLHQSALAEGGKAWL